MTKTYVYVVSWVTESSDRGAYVFGTKPTEKQLEKFFKEHRPEEYESGYCNIYWTVNKTEVLNIKKK